MSRHSCRFTRVVASALVATQAAGASLLPQAIVAATVSEFALTVPGLDSSRAVQAQESPALAEDVYRKAAPAVVFVKTDQGTGSGVIVESNGLIVTNAHVLKGAQQVSVELQNGRTFSAQIVSLGRPGCLDLALLKIEATNLPKVNFAAKRSVQPGQRVFAIGYPRGIKPSSITQGIVSNIDHYLGRVQTDAAIIPGNSGGALLNSRGELLGINTIKGMNANTGMNFAIAADKVQALMQAMKEGLPPVIGQSLIPTSTSARLAATLAFNTTQQGQLQQSSSLYCDGSRADIYTFQGEADQPVMLSMMSSEMGSFLLLLGANGELISKAQSEQGKPAQLMVNLPRRGTYTVIANAASPDQLGRYRLQASTPLIVERSKLSPSDPRLSDGSFYRRYAFSGKAGQAIALALHQFEFDPYVAVYDSAGKIVAQRNANRQDTVRVDLPKDGEYTLIVSTVKPGDRGQFFFSIHAVQNQSQSGQVSQNR